MAVAALAGGAGVAFYAWLWIMVPTADESAKRNARQPASPIAPAVSQPHLAYADPYSGLPTAAASRAWPHQQEAQRRDRRLRRTGQPPAVPGGTGSPACATARRFCSEQACCWPPAS